MEIKKLRFIASGAIDCEINHPAHGWIPFTASPDDASGQEIHARALAGEYGDIQAYVKPDNEPLTVEQVQALRREAYAAESDPLKIEAEYDALSTGLEPDYTAWIAAVQAIKARYPLPETSPVL